MIKRINRNDSYLYAEISKIVQWKDGQIYKTRCLGCIERKLINESELFKQGFILSSLSTRLTDPRLGKTVDLNIITLADII
jgi:hypothetical protein